MSAQRTYDLARARPAVPAGFQRPFVVASVLGALVVLLVGLAHAGESAASGFDAWAERAAAFPDAGRFEMAVLVDFAAEPVGAAIVVALVSGLCWALGRVRLAVLTVACLVPAFATMVLKDFFGRTINGGYLSYPSGHTAFATAIAVVLGLLVADLFALRRATALLVITGLALACGAEMAWAQLTLDTHYATDTLGGFATAIALVPALALVIDTAADGLRRGGGTPV
ncbi:phosphatase PAP2 family protein [Prauserella cavernicola]|uniref:Phosphatase PAP2 family protein n=1 Tax=Prauserella cavernicola TaxID=2800127 RepID=A0A934QR22_9PSEU|nr:phosphatase PAP2 family protein [Prauserella cavernicola]MBK1784129.1 phosphatase PAP2 family protein [Prauserella cavernicola]